MNFLASTTQLPLHDIVDDHSVSWWPLAPGWWFILVALCIGLLWFGLWWRRFRQQRQQQLTVEALLRAPATSISELNLRLKQVLLLKYPRTQLADLNARAWQQRLAAELPESKQEQFLQQLAPYLELQYQAHTQSVVDSYQTLTVEWWTAVRPRFAKGKQDV